jgi:hypothetical protein
MSDVDTIASLAKSVNGLEASRRAGWARSYAAADRADELSRDLNIARADVAMLAKYAGLLHGVLEGVCPAALDAIGGRPSRGVDPHQQILDPHKLKSYLPDQALNAGRAIGFAIRERRSRRRRTGGKL